MNFSGQSVMIPDIPSYFKHSSSSSSLLITQKIVSIPLLFKWANSGAPQYKIVLTYKKNRFLINGFVISFIFTEIKP